MSIYKGTTLIAGSLPNSANQDLSNLSQTGQEILDSKVNTSDVWYDSSSSTLYIGVAQS